MKENNEIESLTHNFKNYVSTNYELIRLEIIERIAILGGDLLSIFLVIVVGLLFISFLSISVGFYLSTYFGDKFLGFGIIAGFYFLVGFLLIICRKKIMEKPLRNIIIHKILYKQQA